MHGWREDQITTKVGLAVGYTWSMRNRDGRSAALYLLLILFLYGCSPTENDKVIVHAVESAQAAVVQNFPLKNEESVNQRPCSDPSADEACLTEEAVAAQSLNEPPVYLCDQVEGRIEQRDYPGFLSGKSIPVIVYLPPCYDPYLQVYPVLFLLHGKPQDESHWLQLGVGEVVDKGILEGTWAPFIIVMPLQPEPLFTYTDGGRGSLEQEIMQGLIPFILDRYAITGEGENWAIAGISRGGVWALEISFQHAAYFQTVAALSPALNVNQARTDYDPLRMLADDRILPAKIFLGAGETDSARAKTLELAVILDGLGVNNYYSEVQGSHESATWTAIIPEMFSFITRDW